MELLFVIVIATAIGGIVRYTVPGRASHGMLLLPAVGAAVAAIVWASLLWSGFTFDGGWIWTITLLAVIVATIGLAVVLPRRRAAAEARLRDELGV